jgi:drug/metabolite transporter (DMT)-like permease
MFQLSVGALFVLNGLLSTGMMLTNKSLASLFPFPSLTVLSQNSVALLGTIILWKLNFFPISSFQMQHFAYSVPGTLIFTFVLLSAILALQFASLPIFSVVSNFRPLLTAVLDYFISGRVARLRQIVGLGLISSGLALTSQGVSAPELKGIGLALLTTSLTSLVAVIDNKLMKEVRSSQSPVGINTYRLLISSSLLLTMLPLEKTGSVAERLNLMTVVLLVLSGLLCLFAGTFWFSLQARTSSTNIQVANIFSKLITTLISLVTHGDFPSLLGWVGYAVSMSGVLVYTLATSTKT